MSGKESPPGPSRGEASAESEPSAESEASAESEPPAVDASSSAADAPAAGPDSDTDPMPGARLEPEAPDAADHIPVVAIGASAGGVQALRSFFDALPTDTGMAYVVIMHLAPKRRSHLAEVLQRKTSLPVSEVTGDLPVEPNHIYVIPPDKRLMVADHTLSVTDFEEPRGRRAPIDLFFRSVARELGDGAAIVLSGSGSDGSVGIKDVKEAGGLILAQDPDEAEYDSMPRSAIATGMVDVVLPVQELALQLVELKRRWGRLPREVSELSDGDSKDLRRVLDQLQARTGHGFHLYKQSTVLRRIQRRMQVSGRDQIAEYLAFLREDEEEAAALFRDLLIGVTNFFRNAEAFEALRTKVIPKLFQEKEADGSVRVWTTGCSTGEEAYSLAMLLEEHVQTLDVWPRIQIFATDLDERALANARRGLYPLGIEADVSEERLERFFRREGDHYRICRSIRQQVLFASHNMIRDTPFSRLDLIVCRNVLIYMQRDLQDRAFDVFHYALQPQGYLFLGASETAEGVPDLFGVVDKRHRLFRVKKRVGEAPRLPLLEPTLFGRQRRLREPRSRPGTPDAQREVHRRSLEEYAPPSVLVDENQHVLHLSDRAGRYLELPGGPLTGDVTKLVRSELQGEVRSALFRALDKGEATVARPVPVRLHGELRTVYLSVRPASEQKGTERRALVVFDEAEEGLEAPPTRREKGREEDPHLSRLETELHHTQERLQTTTEEFESSREEFQAQNEELLSMNEEYKSAMEELETSKEELQSLNEELQTVNNELNNKVEEISRAHADVQNLVAASDVETLFLDKELRIKRYTEDANEHFNIRPGDRGRALSDLTHRLRYDDLEEDARRVIRDQADIERHVEDQRGRWYLLRLRPYRTVDDRIDGVVVTLVDITDLKDSETRERAAREYAEAIVNSVRDGVLVLDQDLRVRTASTSFLETFRVSPEETEGRRVYELGNGQWDIPDLRRLLEEILPEAGILNDFEVRHRFEEIGERIMLVNARQLDHHQLILLVITDVTRG